MENHPIIWKTETTMKFDFMRYDELADFYGFQSRLTY